MNQEISRPTYLERQSQVTTPAGVRIKPMVEALKQPLSSAERRAIVAQYFPPIVSTVVETA